MQLHSYFGLYTLFCELHNNHMTESRMSGVIHQRFQFFQYHYTKKNQLVSWNIIEGVLSTSWHSFRIYYLYSFSIKWAYFSWTFSLLNLSEGPEGEKRYIHAYCSWNVIIQITITSNGILAYGAFVFTYHSMIIIIIKLNGSGS